MDLTTHTSLSPIRRGFVPGFVNYKKGCTRLAAASDKVYQLLAHDRWFSSGTPASSTTKTGRHDIAEILLKVALKHQKSKSKKSNQLKNYEIIHVDTNYSTLYIWAVVLLLSESRTIINDLDVILHGFVLQIIYTTVFRVKRFNNLTLRTCTRYVNR